MKSILVIFSVFISEDKSNHCIALLMLAKANRPSGLCSANRRCSPSCGMTRETKEELLLTMLFLGLRFLVGSLESFVLTRANAGFPSPKAGVWEDKSA